MQVPDKNNHAALSRESRGPLPEKLPQPTIWPVTVALGLTLLALGVPTHWIMSLAGLLLFLLGWFGWFEDLRHEQL